MISIYPTKRSRRRNRYKARVFWYNAQNWWHGENEFDINIEQYVYRLNKYFKIAGYKRNDN